MVREFFAGFPRALSVPEALLWRGSASLARREVTTRSGLSSSESYHDQTRSALEALAYPRVEIPCSPPQTIPEKGHTEV
jgi:hypothetical protein